MTSCDPRQSSCDKPTLPRSLVDLWSAERIGVGLGDLSQGSLGRYQLAQVRTMVGYVKERSRFYEERLRDVNPCDIQTMADFQCLPTASENDLAGHEREFACMCPKDVRRVVTVPTTGTHGRSKRLSFSVDDLQRAMGFVQLGFRSFCEPGDRMLVMMSGNTEGSIGDVVGKALAPLDMEVRVSGPIRSLSEAYEVLRDYGPQDVVGVPCQLAALARYSQTQGGLHVRNVLLSADDVPQSVCNRLSLIWGCETFRHYGMTELCIAGGVECHAHTGYHLRACDHLFEVLDPDADGWGELAVTTFSHQAMPLLRYRTGDIVCMDSATCSCGSPLQRMAAFRGRLSNSFEYPNGRLFLSEVAEVAFADSAVTDFDCAAGQGLLRVELSTLPGDHIDEVAVLQRFASLPALEGYRWN